MFQLLTKLMHCMFAYKVAKYLQIVHHYSMTIKVAQKTRMVGPELQRYCRSFKAILLVHHHEALIIENYTIGNYDETNT